jgi:hypothetical protein
MKAHLVCILGLQPFEMQATVQQSTDCFIPENFSIQQQLCKKPIFRIAIVPKLLRTQHVLGLQ